MAAQTPTNVKKYLQIPPTLKLAAPDKKMLKMKELVSTWRTLNPTWTPDVQAKLELLQQKYMKSKLMLALVRNVAEKTVTKFLGENKPPRKKCGWNRFVAFSLESLKYRVPSKGTLEGWEDQNVNIGKAWLQLLPDEEKEVFKEDDKDNEEAETSLSPEEIKQYIPLYEKLVNTEKVNIFAAKGSELQGESASETYKKALKKYSQAEFGAAARGDESSIFPKTPNPAETLAKTDLELKIERVPEV
ncbi:hypothetical protein PtA15_13A22 [Puccinia triticina]|uniref:HMG box domain-containing protein n=1 Tax=Puccinia triticina TaxID=208348 RepID=A0ABY7D188_9BASI|nr:uncharacterized protein PtA15_13A22 [Puccinia triticina]WAQ90624.1 hypothetical protein PtA15_13A22 [Puccinia triticina]